MNKSKTLEQASEDIIKFNKARGWLPKSSDIA